MPSRAPRKSPRRSSTNDFPDWAPRLCVATWESFHRYEPDRQDVKRALKLLTKEASTPNGHDGMNYAWPRLVKRFSEGAAESFFLMACAASRGFPTNDAEILERSSQLLDKLRTSNASRDFSRLRLVGSRSLEKQLSEFLSAVGKMESDGGGFNPFDSALAKGKAKFHPYNYFVRAMTNWAWRRYGEPMRYQVTCATNVLFGTSLDERGVKDIAKTPKK